MSSTLREELKNLALEYEIMSEGIDGSLSYYFDDIAALIQRKQVEARVDELKAILKFQIPANTYKTSRVRLLEQSIEDRINGLESELNKDLKEGE